MLTNYHQLIVDPLFSKDGIAALPIEWSKTNLNQHGFFRKRNILKDKIWHNFIQ